MRVGVFLGSVRPTRNVERVYALVANLLSKRGIDIVKLVYPLERKLPLLELPVHYYPDQDKAPENVRQLNEDIESCDSFVVLSSEYNRSTPPALSNTLDYACPLSYAFKPAGIIVYSLGPTGGVCAMSPVRDILSELGCITLPDVPSIPFVNQAIDESGAPTSHACGQTVEKNINRLIDQLEFVGEAMIAKRKSGSPLPKLHAYI
ncbi:hypothetical protein Ciccas_002943 [Cichlidogyrus casuarinus]|uniref:NADPH-dependent FMN reductase-like domain-containing protein n=1 Tax=Cichlidogyrus casuarinus TaxID=1844966 RepID=A0ABD2QFT1_9PLAT